MRARQRGFTLVELLVVVTIISILLSFILKAYLGSVAVAEKSATVSLIAKLETALIDRMDALSNQYQQTTQTHYDLASIWTGPSTPIVSHHRAQVIAKFDYMRAELPDVFVIEAADTDYPLNFGAERFSPTATAFLGDWRDYALPLGAGNPSGDVPITGMKGASFTASAGIYKQLGYVVPGLDGIDNDGDGLIDEMDEGCPTPADRALVLAKLARHTHKTARAEMLYAVLVEAAGPLGSIFNRDDFHPAEVRDTDGDGLLEFVDAYGEPVQFFRWPIMFRSETQKGFPDLAKIAQDLANSAPIGPYVTVFESREQDPLDANQLLQAPGWWGSFNSSYPWGSPRKLFGSMFHTIVDPLAVQANGFGIAPSNATINTYWDRSTTTPTEPGKVGINFRRAYYSRFLVLSGGPDKRPGVAQLGVNYTAIDERGSFPVPGGVDSGTRDSTGGLVPVTVANVIQIENQGGAIDPNRNASGSPVLTSGRNDTSTLLEEFGHDDISNMNLHAAGGPLPAPR